jgi:hypothetical protein
LAVPIFSVLQICGQRDKGRVDTRVGEEAMRALSMRRRTTPNKSVVNIVSTAALPVTSTCAGVMTIHEKAGRSVQRRSSYRSWHCPFEKNGSLKAGRRRPQHKVFDVQFQLVNLTSQRVAMDAQFLCSFLPDLHLLLPKPWPRTPFGIHVLLPDIGGRFCTSAERFVRALPSRLDLARSWKAEEKLKAVTLVML